VIDIAGTHYKKAAGFVPDEGQLGPPRAEYAVWISL
jgi:hypothetical protein